MKRSLSLLLLVACTRKEPPPLAAEGVHLAAPPRAVVDASAPPVAAAVASPFSIIARGPAPTQRPPAMHGNDIAAGDPLLQRLPDGGVAFGAEHVIALAEGAGPLVVGPPGPEREVQLRAPMVQTAEGLRWVWMSRELAIYSLEEATMRTGPRVSSFRRGPKGWEAVRGTTGWWSAVRRGDSVLALQRSTYEIPHSSIYVGDETTNQHTLTTPKIAVLAGKGPAPVLPKDVCATAMASGSDGTLVVTVDRCGSHPESNSVGVLRYGPGSTTAKVEWLGTYKSIEDDRHAMMMVDEPVLPAVGGPSDIWVARATRLSHWDGTRWSTVDQEGEPFLSLSAAPDGALWAVRDDKLVKRAKGETAFTEVPLPLTPADRLDPELWTLAGQLSRHVHRGPTPSDDAFTRAPVAAPMQALFVDASEPEVLVLGGLQDEVFALSTTPRTPVARIPSMSEQRAIVARAAKHKVATTAKECTSGSFLTFPDETTADQVKTRLREADGAIVGEAMVEGRKRLVLVADDILATEKKLAALKPTRLCDFIAIERDL